MDGHHHLNDVAVVCPLTVAAPALWPCNTLSLEPFGSTFRLMREGPCGGLSAPPTCTPQRPLTYEDTKEGGGGAGRTAELEAQNGLRSITRPGSQCSNKIDSKEIGIGKLVFRTTGAGTLKDPFDILISMPRREHMQIKTCSKTCFTSALAAYLDMLRHSLYAQPCIRATRGFFEGENPRKPSAHAGARPSVRPLVPLLWGFWITPNLTWTGRHR